MKEERKKETTGQKYNVCICYAGGHNNFPSYPPDNHHSSDDVYRTGWRNLETDRANFTTTGRQEEGHYAICSWADRRQLS